ncbi:hypothetical protein [Enterococcus faecalis]|uniref:hypothetical protein n=1 Tax=Enterococcus faecalis TaxID=1351 RepID=UPI0015E8E459
MKKKIAVLLATCLLVQPFLSVSAWAIEGEQQTERRRHSQKQQKPVQVKQQKKAAHIL